MKSYRNLEFHILILSSVLNKIISSNKKKVCPTFRGMSDTLQKARMVSMGSNGGCDCRDTEKKEKTIFLKHYFNPITPIAPPLFFTISSTFLSLAFKLSYYLASLNMYK